MRLYSAQSERLYLNSTEVDRFLHAANDAPEMVRLFALTLAYTGMRLSEACCLRRDSIQADARVLSVLSLKKRQKRAVREIPIPAELALAFMSLDLEGGGWIGVIDCRRYRA
ncbi:tyrosine-type recombinase/integrase [uncultured Tateyamaria sp.]